MRVTVRQGDRGPPRCSMLGHSLVGQWLDHRSGGEEQVCPQPLG